MSLRFRGGISAGVFVVLAIASAPIAATAQPTASDRISTIERQIQTLQGEMQQLKSDLGEAKEQLRQSRADARRAREELRLEREAAATRRAAPPPQALAAGPRPAALPPQTVAAAPPPTAPPPPEPRVVQTSTNRFGLASADGRNSIYLTGRLHFDVGDYLRYEPASKFAAVQNLHSGVNARRARIGVTGKFAGDWAYTLIYDFGGSSDGFPPTTGAPVSGIEKAYVTYNGFNKGPLPLALDLGYMKTPLSLAQASSSNDIMFIERPSSVTVATGLFADGFRSALGARSNDKRYWAGVYLTGPTSGASHVAGKQVGAFGRAAYQILDGPDYSLHLGADAGAMLKPPTATVGGVANVGAVTLAERPELRIDPTTVLSTGVLGTAANPVTGAQVYGVEGAAGWRSFFLQGEYYHIDLDRRRLVTNGFDGGYIEGSWTISGEHRKYIPETGAYSGILPDRPFEPWAENYGTGAWELAFRYSTINLNSHFIPGIVPAATSNAVGGGKQTVYGVGVNWYLNANMRMMFDFLHGTIAKRFSTVAGGGIAGTPLGRPVGGNFDALATRMQFAF